MKHSWLFIVLLLFGATIVAVLIGSRAQMPTQPVEEPVPVISVPKKPALATKDDMIVLESPLPGTAISSPLQINGKARGNWYFEGSFPITLVDWDGRIIAQGHASAQGDWMVTDYVPFTATLSFTKPDTSVSSRGSLILKNDNPSGDPAYDRSLEVEIKYQ